MYIEFLCFIDSLGLMLIISRTTVDVNYTVKAASAKFSTSSGNYEVINSHPSYSLAYHGIPNILTPGGMLNKLVCRPIKTLVDMFSNWQIFPNQFLR